MKTQNMKSRMMVALSLALVAGAVGAKTLVEVPVSGKANAAYLTDMKNRAWWNKAWKKRAAILVSNMTDVRTVRTTIDFVFDPGEPVKPEDIRIVTPWETVVPCVAVGKRVLFQTDLREEENRPFFVYWDRGGDAPATEGKQPATVDLDLRSRPRFAISLCVRDDEVYVNNGAVEVVFDNLHRTPGFIRTLKANGSQTPSELLWRTTGFAWEGFSLETDARKEKPKLDPAKVRPGNKLDEQIHMPDLPGGWSKAIVTADNALLKTITFTNEFATVDFTFRAGEPRVDYAYRLAPGLERAHINVAWAVGGGIAHDDFYYQGLAGKILTLRAGLDWVTDCEPGPETWRFPWFGNGWYAIVDRRNRDTVGWIFDYDSFDGVSYLAGCTHCGQASRFRFRHKPAKGECATGTGALVATVGDMKDVVREEKFLRHPPKVFVAQAEPYREVPVRVRDLAHDFCINMNCGGWKSSKPLEGDEWKVGLLNHLRARGANTILLGQLTDYNWEELPVSKEFYDRICARQLKKNPKWKAPAWGEGNFTGKNLKALCAAAHARGMPVMTWHNALPVGESDAFSAEDHALCREYQALYPKCGVDSAFNAMGGGEGTPIPREITQKYGRAFWTWENPDLFFQSRKETAKYMKEFYDYSHKVNPNARVMVFNSDNGELGREMCMPYFPGAMDTLFCEIVASDGNIDKIKHTVKRLRGYFDNEDGRTIFAHYYCMRLDYWNRVSELEMPFLCGINGFSQEAMCYENAESENMQFSADFNRFAGYTGIGDKAAKMGPVKNLAVYRDMNCFEEDCRKHRTQSWHWGYQVTRQDVRINAIARIRSFNYDIVHNPFFKLESLKRYNVLFIPEDEVLSEEDAKTALQYVEQGGGLVLEGDMVGYRGGDAPATKDGAVAGASSPRSKGCELFAKLNLKPGVVARLGNGRIIWSEEVLTDRLLKNDLGAGQILKDFVAAVGGKNPFRVERADGQKPYADLDGILQASKEGLMFGVYNRADAPQAGKVVLAEGVVERCRCTKNESTSVQPSTSNLQPRPLFVLDVRTGVRVPLTNRSFTISVAPRQCGFYLIGDDAFTSVPAVREAAWCGATATAAFPSGHPTDKKPGEAFQARENVEFVSPAPRNFAGLPAEIQRSAKAMLIRHRFCATEPVIAERAKADDLEAWMKTNADGAKFYSKTACRKALAKASYVHVQCRSEDCDAMFEDCAEELKAMFKRGGGLLFNRTKPGPKAQKFLADIGVADPWPSSQKGFEGNVKWSPSVSTNHPLAKAKGSWYNSHIGSSWRFTKWDEAKQYAPYDDSFGKKAAVMVIQEKVLGAGKVVFSHCENDFTAWYENYEHGDGVLSFLLGMSVKEHAEKVMLMNGGPGTIVQWVR